MYPVNFGSSAPIEPSTRYHVLPQFIDSFCMVGRATAATAFVAFGIFSFLAGVASGNILAIGIGTFLVIIGSKIVPYRSRYSHTPRGQPYYALPPLPRPHPQGQRIEVGTGRVTYTPPLYSPPPYTHPSAPPPPLYPEVSQFPHGSRIEVGTGTTLQNAVLRPRDRIPTGH